MLQIGLGGEPQVQALSQGRARGFLQSRPEDEEVRWLRREVAKLKAERGILTKAVAYFAKDQL